MMRSERTTLGTRDVFLIALMIILGGLYFSLSYNGVFFPPDEGATAYHFEKVTEGAVQHRDFYSVYGMAYYVLGKNLFQLFGPKLIVLRIFTVGVKLIMAVLIYLIAIQLMRRKFAFLSAMGFVVWWADPFVMTPIYLYPAHLSQLLGLLSILFVFAFINSDQKRFILFAGITAGLNSLFKPNVGVFNLMALFLFFIGRETLLDLSGDPQAPVTEEGRQRFPYGKAGLILELVITFCAFVAMFHVFSKFGFDLAVFFYFLLPICLVVALLFAFARKALRVANGEAPCWKNFKDTFAAHWLLAAGFAFCHLLQIAYFAGHGALGDFFHMLGTASKYYSGYAVAFRGSGMIIASCTAALLICIVFNIIIKKTAASGPRQKILLACSALLLAAGVPAYWGVRRHIPGLHMLAALTIPLFCSIVASLFLAYKDSQEGVGGKDVSSPLRFLLVCTYASANLLDAFPKVDLGHLFMILPPIVILLGFLAQRIYDLWKNYLKTALPRAGRAMAGAIVGILALQIFLPNLIIMLMFHVLIIPSAQRGFHLYEGKLALVPRYSPNIERAEGIAIHTVRGEYWPPLVSYRRIDFFDIAERISAMTSKEDKLFSTMSSATMLYFLADRDSVSDKANCYIYQTAMGTTTSRLIEDFSDNDLVRIIHAERPAAVVIEEKSNETASFIGNWPTTWNLIMSNYRLAEQIGDFQIYVPKGRSMSAKSPLD